MKSILSVIVLLGALAANAQIYTWVDANGVRHYSDSGANSRAQKAHLPDSQGADGDPDAPARPQAAADSASSAGHKAPEARMPRVTEPGAQQIFRDAGATVPVDVTIGGANELRAGEKITYYLDGRPISQSPTDQTRLQLVNVPRGAHTLSAALLYQGREIRRAPPVTFYMKPSSTTPAVDDGTSNEHGRANAAPEASAARAKDNPSGAPAPAQAGNDGAAPG